MEPETDPSFSQPYQGEITRREIFYAFLMIGLSGFGGVLPWAHRKLVEQKRWLSEKEFTELLSLGQIVPGPNIVNLSIMVGARFQGVQGAVLAFFGLMLAPLIIVLSLGALYEQYGQIELVRRAVSGVAAVAAGLVIATAFKLAVAQPRRFWPMFIGVLAFVSVGLLRLPLVLVLLSLAPVGLVAAWKFMGASKN
ncbi:MAG: chromate transporter [Pseudomonadota bacterium]